jgi:hypothetical protein
MPHLHAFGISVPHWRLQCSCVISISVLWKHGFSIGWPLLLGFVLFICRLTPFILAISSSWVGFSQPEAGSVSTQTINWGPTQHALFLHYLSPLGHPRSLELCYWMRATAVISHSNHGPSTNFGISFLPHFSFTTFYRTGWSRDNTLYL